MRRRSIVRKRLLYITLAIGLGLAYFYGYVRPRYTVPILMYHHIDAPGRNSSLSVSAQNFTRQMRFLARHNYNVIPLTRLGRAIKKGESLPRNTVVITFDDGYADNYTQAFRVLLRHALPATIFVIAGSIGKEDYLTEAQLKELVSSGIIDIGSHSLAGDYLPGQTEEQLEREIGLSKQLLENSLKEAVDVFCYPIGGFTAQIQELVKKSGYLAACTTNRGQKQTCLNEDIFALKRIKVTDSSPNLLVFWVKVSGYYNLFRRVRNPN